MQMRCPCGTTLKVPDTAAGKTVRCPKCSVTLRVPAAAAPPAARPQTRPPVPTSPPAASRPPAEVDFGSLGGFGSPATPAAAGSFGGAAPAFSPPASTGGASKPINPYQPTSAMGIPGAGAAPAGAEATRQQNLSHESSLRSIGLLYLLGGGFGLFFGLILVFGLVVGLFAGGGGPGAAELGLVAFFVLLWVGFSAAQFFVGLKLRGLENWARITAGVLSVPGLLGIPVGTIISAYFLYILFSAKGAYVCSPEYRAVVNATPHIKYQTPVVVWILLGLIILLVVGAVLLAMV